jgi:NADH-quinone oxidoreductase subunit J
MWEQEVAFWIIAVAMAGAAIGVVRSANVVHAALFLVVVLAGSAALYILLAAEFVAWVQVLIYLGAVIVLFLFGIMLTRAPMHDDAGKLDNDQRWAGAVVAVFVFGVLTALLVDAFGGNDIHFGSDLVAQGRAANVAGSIFRSYVVPFEVVSMLLLAALVGAIVLARRD